MTDAGGCTACADAAADPRSGLFHAGCSGCEARSLATSPGYMASVAAMKFRADYAAALRAIAGDDASARDALHRRVREWDRRMREAAQAERQAQPARGAT